jgi:hypothetical protein
MIRPGRTEWFGAPLLLTPACVPADQPRAHAFSPAGEAGRTSLGLHERGCMWEQTRMGQLELVAAVKVF